RTTVGEQRDVQATEVGRRSVLHRDLAVLPGQGRARGPRGREEAHLADRELTLVEQVAHDCPDLAGGTEDSNTHVSSVCAAHRIPLEPSSAETGRGLVTSRQSLVWRMTVAIAAPILHTSARTQRGAGGLEAQALELL